VRQGEKAFHGILLEQEVAYRPTRAYLQRLASHGLTKEGPDHRF